MTHKVGIYCRISRDRIGAGLGVERQEEDCRELAERLGGDVVDVYVDNDISAYSGKRRPNYERLLADVEAGRVTAVVAWHTDRLHRAPMELERYITACEPRNVPTYTVKAGELDLTTAAGRMTARITGAVARHESEQKSERLARQRRQAMEQGRWIGGRRPFGFEDDGMTVRAVEADALRSAARRVLAGDTVRSIFREWNAAGLTTVTGQPWTGSSLREVLLRPRNTAKVGKLRRPYGDVGAALDKMPDAQWPAILDRELYRALAQKLVDPARTAHRGVSRRLVGSWLYRCECGQPLRSGGLSSTGKPRYMCSEMHLVRTAQPLDELVLGMTAAILDREGTALLAPAVDLTPHRERLAVLRAKSEELASLYADPDGGMTIEQFQVANKRLQGGIKHLETEIARHTAGDALAGVADAARPGETFLGLDIDRQRAIIDCLMTVTVKRIGRGRPQNTFDPGSVVMTPKR
ncbi:recombinase family protein [Amycolatopsis tucumanensis]|uniref:Recombinase n=1 Tax=Amycolatopsis tucumanensis TaxID=401106 RepID=A0ABP7JR71_9PSEU|nr:recombinase family protein [Amycolatopsis tucumanensis]MCF6425064.1 recombinase family protein [Amycolatopsis tucumanensis]